MSVIERLKDRYEKSKSDEHFILDKMQDEKMVKHFVMSLESKNIDFALFHIFVSENYDAARNDFYRAGSVVAFGHEKFNAEVFIIRFFQSSVLSDSEGLINRFSKFDKSINKQSFPYIYSKVIQSLLLKNFPESMNYILQLEKLITKGWPKFYKGSVMTFKGLVTQDTSLVANGILQQIADHPNIETLDLWKELISLEAVVLAKLANRFGFAPEIESTLVPKEFLPVKPLSIYTGYPILEGS